MNFAHFPKQAPLHPNELVFTVHGAPDNEQANASAAPQGRVAATLPPNELVFTVHGAPENGYVNDSAVRSPLRARPPRTSEHTHFSKRAPLHPNELVFTVHGAPENGYVNVSAVRSPLRARPPRTSEHTHFPKRAPMGSEHRKADYMDSRNGTSTSSIALF
jgi:hypothetical protein